LPFRELLTLVPKLSPAQESATSGSGIVDRLQAGAAKLVRIERTDGVGNDRGAVVARVTAAALRNDFAEARRELKPAVNGDAGRQLYRHRKYRCDPLHRYRSGAFERSRMAKLQGQQKKKPSSIASASSRCPTACG
jgi:hypothetical protein